MHIELNAMRAECDRFLEAGNRVFGQMAFGAAVANVEQFFHCVKIKNAFGIKGAFKNYLFCSSSTVLNSESKTTRPLSTVISFPE